MNHTSLWGFIFLVVHKTLLFQSFVSKSCTDPGAILTGKSSKELLKTHVEIFLQGVDQMEGRILLSIRQRVRGELIIGLSMQRCLWGCGSNICLSRWTAVPVRAGGLSVTVPWTLSSGRSVNIMPKSLRAGVWTSDCLGSDPAWQHPGHVSLGK